MPVTVITAVPTCISPDEHRERTASTPASFSDIPPVLRHRDENARVVFDPPLPELTEEELKKGTVYILESALVFISASSGRGFQIDYPSIILHAVSRSEPASIYCQLGEPASEVVDGVEDEEEATELRELNIYPESASSLNEFFEALSQCASLHPDPTESDEDMDDSASGSGDEAVDADVEAVQAITAEGVDGEPELSEAGRATLGRLESLIQNNSTKINGIHADAEEDQFADAPECSR